MMRTYSLFKGMINLMNKIRKKSKRNQRNLKDQQKTPFKEKILPTTPSDPAEEAVTEEVAKKP